jgi:SAM-dependent methyltransferase
MDVWGQIFRDHQRGEVEPHFFERDDGREEIFRSAAIYFEAPRSEAERELLGRLEGPVLDLGAGAGSYTLYLQDQGLQVTAADSSPQAVEVCRSRGCEDARVMDLRSLELEPESFQSVIVMGTTLGAHQTPASLPRLLSALRRAVPPDGKLLCQMADPLDTLDDAHLLYHQRNRDRGLPPGLIRLRIRYKNLVDEWMNLWMPTDDELAVATAASGWTLLEEPRDGPYRVRLFQATGS